jgi:hypothetical protein
MSFYRISTTIILLSCLISCEPGINDNEYLEKVHILGAVVLVDQPSSIEVFARISAPATDTISSGNGTFIIQGDVYNDEVIPLTFSKDGYLSVTIEITIERHAQYTGTVLLYPDIPVGRQ